MESGGLAVAWWLEHRTPARWSFSDLLGFGQSTWGLGVLGGHRNPQQIQICGRLEYLCLDMPPLCHPVSSSPPVAKAGASGPGGEAGKLMKERAAKAPSTFWVQVLKSAQKALLPPPTTTTTQPPRVAQTTLVARDCWFPIPPAPR